MSAVRAAVSSAGTIGDLSDSTITNLIVFGTSVSEPTPNLEIPLADWGSLTVLRESTSQGQGFVPAWRGTVTALVVHLDREHLGLPAGSTIRIGFADASARAAGANGDHDHDPAGVYAEVKERARRSRAATASSSSSNRPRPLVATGAAIDVRAGDVRRPKQKRGGLPVRTDIPVVTPKLTAGGYVFPVYGPSAYGDTFGAPRGDVSGGWHHGDDIFAPLGRADPRGRRRHGLLRRLERHRRLPALAARPRRERVLLRAPLRLHDARRQRPRT